MSPNQRIDRYELMGLLGRGGTGRVYHAWDSKLEREVALKVVVQTADEKSRERFHREVCAIAALRHPNIVEIYDYSGLNTDQLYYVMERLDGDDLFNLMQAHGPIPEPATAVIGHELCLALSFMHEAGIIHRDLKPENVYLNAQGRVVLTDFGIVKAVRENTAVSGFDDKTDIVGTPGFMSPEMLTSKALGSYTDVFSLGACLYNIVTGELPFAANSPLELHDSIQSGVVVDARDYNPQISEMLWECLRQCLAARPKERPTVAGVREYLKAVLDAYAVSDIRDELAAYMRNAGVYGESARQRAARRLGRELALAEEVEDITRITVLQQRLLHVDPDGHESSATTELLAAARSRPHGWEPRHHRRRRVVVAVGLVVLMLLIVALLLTGELRTLVARARGTTAVVEPVASPNVGSSTDELTPLGSQGLLEVRVNGPANVSVAGERLNARDQQGKRFAPGHYRVEVAGARKRLTAEVEVIAGRHVLVNADLKRGQIRVE